jgi:hypothetical protein
MEEKLIEELKKNKVREMKNPNILMNTKDLEIFLKEIEDKVSNFQPIENPDYMGVPIKARDYIQKGDLIIYDNVNFNSF